MLTTDDYISEMKSFASVLGQAFKTEPHWVSYTGGVPGMEIKLPASDYEHAKKWLTATFGEPEVKKPWHPSHTKGVPPLRFHITPQMEHLKVSHINLISMMQRKDKRYMLITWM